MGLAFRQRNVNRYWHKRIIIRTFYKMPMQSFRTLADATIIVIRILNSKHTDSFIKREHHDAGRSAAHYLRGRFYE